MAIINPEEWQKIKEQIDYGLEHYGDNIAELIKIYKSIKTVLTDHGFNPGDKLTGAGVKQYPLIIAQSFLDLETKIQELQGIIVQRDNTISQYEGNFSDIADAIISRGVNISEDDPYDIYPSKILAIGTGQTVFNGLGAFNEYGYLSGDVKIPEGVTILGQGVVYYGNYLKTLTLPKTLESFDDYALCRGDTNFPINLQEIIFPINCTKIGVKACRQLGTAISQPASITFLSSKNLFTLKEQCFFESKIGEVIFLSTNSSGTDIYIQKEALRGTQPLKIQFPINSHLYLYTTPFSNNALDINLEDISAITLKSNQGLALNKLTDNQVNKILPKLTSDSIATQAFLSCNQLRDIYFDFHTVGSSMFYNTGLTKITFNNKLKTLITSGINTNTVEIVFDNLDSFEDNSIAYYSMLYDGNTADPQNDEFRFNKHYIIHTQINQKPIMRNLICTSGRIYENQKLVEWKFMNMLTQEYKNTYYGEGYCQRGYGLWTNTIKYPTNDEVYKVLSKINPKLSGMFGILNGLKGISHLHLPYSSSQFWGGNDPQGVLTSDFISITFDTCGWDPTIQGYSTGPFIFSLGGFNNLKKLIWTKTEPNSVIRSQTLGMPYYMYRNETKTWKMLQNLEEVYFGEGATILESYIFASFFPDMYRNSGDVQYAYTYNSNATICPYNYPKLKTLYLPGSITVTRDNCLVINNSDNFYLHPLYCGIGNIDNFSNLDQILLGPGWSLSIELTSLCFRDSSNNPYYNLSLTPEAMIFNINNLKDCSDKSYSKQLIVTNKTLYDLRIYCNQNQGQEKVILANTECEMTQLIPSYDNLIKLANDKNWEIISVAHSTWTSNLTDSNDNLIVDANTNSITT